MNNVEMQYEFTKLIQEMDEIFEAIKRPSSETIFRMLNYATDRYIKEKYLSGPSMKANIQEIQYRSDDLRNLISLNYITSPRTPAAKIYDEELTIDLPTDYMFYMRSDSKILRSVTPAMSAPEWTPNRIANYDEIDKIVTSPTNKPILRKPVIVFNENEDIRLFHDRYTTISSFSLTYLRRPKLLVLDVSDPNTQTTECELALHTHEDVVKLAVSMYIDEYKTHLTTSK